MLTHKAVSAVLLGVISLTAADTLEVRAWDVVTQALQNRDERSATALGMLGAIDDPKSRALIDAIFKSKDTAGINYVAPGLTPAQCVHYIADLGTAAENPHAGTVLTILDAIARAGTVEAAEILADIADRARQPTAGVAFGLLAERMGAVADPVLIRVVTDGRSALARETAAVILGRKKATSALVAFRSALHDPDEKVRVAAALGLLRLGYRDGSQQIEAAAGDAGNEYQTEALVALAAMGRSEGFARLEALMTDPDEAVRGRTAWAVARSGNAGLKQFAYRLGLDRQSAFRSMIAEKLLDPNDPRDASALREMLTGSDGVSQLIAAERLLGTGSSSRAEPIVARALVSENGAIRQLALRIASGYPELWPELAKRLASPDPDAQIAALSAIADLRQRDRFKEVALYLASESRGVSLAAARTLVALDPSAARDVFGEGLKSKISHVRIHSAAMLLAIAAHGQRK